MPWIVRLLIFAVVLSVVRVNSEALFVPAAIVLALLLNPFSPGRHKTVEEQDHERR